MSEHSFYTRQMLSRYGRQLVSARRLARYEFLLGKEAPPEATLAVRRKIMVERVAREIIDNLIFSGSDNPVVEDVKDALEEKTGMKLEFQYPPADLNYKIFEIRDDGSKHELSDTERHKTMEMLWEVTLDTVNATML